MTFEHEMFSVWWAGRLAWIGLDMSNAKMILFGSSTVQQNNGGQWNKGKRGQMAWEDWFTVSPLKGEKPQILLNLQLRYSVVVPPWGPQRGECGCTTTNLPVSSSIKIVSEFKWLNAILHSQTSAFKSVKYEKYRLQTISSNHRSL